MHDDESLFGTSIKRTSVNKVYFNQNYVTSTDVNYNYAILSKLYVSLSVLDIDLGNEIGYLGLGLLSHE